MQYRKLPAQTVNRRNAPWRQIVDGAASDRRSHKPTSGNTRRQILCLVLFSFSFFAGSSLCENFALGQIPPDRNALLNAEDLGQAQVAESNGYPGPKRVFEMAKDLQLTELQLSIFMEFTLSEVNMFNVNSAKHLLFEECETLRGVYTERSECAQGDKTSQVSDFSNCKL